MKSHIYTVKFMSFRHNKSYVQLYIVYFSIKFTLMQDFLKQKNTQYYMQTAQKTSHILNISTESYFLFLEVINPAIAKIIITPATPPKI